MSRTAPALGHRAGRSSRAEDPVTTAARGGGRQRPPAASSTCSGSASPPTGCRPAPPRRLRRPTRADAPQATAVGVADAVPAAQAALVNGVLAHSLDYDDTHLPSVLHPSASVVPAALAAAEAAGAAGAGTGRPRSPWASRSAYGSAWPATTRELGNSSFFEHGQHATSICGAHGRRRRRGAAAAACRRERLVRRAGRRRLHGRRHHRGQPHRRHRQAAALRLGRARGRHRRASWSGAASPVRRPCWRGASASSRRSCAASTTAPGRPTGSAPDWAVPGIFFKPYPANHFTHAAIDAGHRPARAGPARWTGSSDSSSACPPAVIRTIGEPIETQARAARPATRPSSAARTRWRRGCSAAVRPRRRAGRLHRRTGAGPGPPGADGQGRRGARRDAATRSSRTSSPPCSRSSPDDGREWTRGGAGQPGRPGPAAVATPSSR